MRIDIGSRRRDCGVHGCHGGCFGVSKRHLLVLFVDEDEDELMRMEATIDMRFCHPEDFNPGMNERNNFRSRGCFLVLSSYT